MSDDDRLLDHLVRLDSRCPECGLGFDADAWDYRHSDVDGNDVHERCCSECGPQDGGF
jgi:ribosomal protein S27AE